MEKDVQIPEGYMRDAMGRLVPLSLIKPIDQERDRLVREITTRGKELSALLAEAKARMFSDVGAFVDLSAEQYGAKLGGKKGNLTLFSFDGSLKVELRTASSIKFDERLQAAKALIDDCAAEWTEGSRAEVKVVIQEAFRADKDGELSVSRILGLRRWAITDHRWQQAMVAINDSIQVVGSKQYIRLFERVGDTDRYAPISLDVAAV